MIAFVEGTVEEVHADRVVLRVGGFGMELLATPKTLAHCQPGGSRRLLTHLVVREDAWTLYGFAEAEGRALFRSLLGVSGVGPKLALAVLGALTPQQVAQAVSHGDAALLATAPGVGKRLAERLVVELSGKLPESLGSSTTIQTATASEAVKDAVDALLALGFRESSVRTVIGELAADAPQATAEQLIRKGLSKLR